MSDIRNKNELHQITGGGINFTSGLINALATSARVILELGRSLGSSLRRSWGRDFC